MTDLRYDELRGEQVVYAIDRQERTFLPPAEHCPLCPTRPGGEPSEIPFPAFEIAVFENRFPALRPPGGAAEVVVYTDAHTGSLGTLPRERARALMWVWRHRYAELGARADVEYVYVFENRGVEVGVTLHHPHGQIYAFPFVPPIPARELAADARLGGCAECELSRRELADGRRVVYEDGYVLAYVPYAARWAYEAHVVVRAHRPSLLECDPAELDALADGLQALARGYDALFGRPFPYVMAMHQAPTTDLSPAKPSPAGSSTADPSITDPSIAGPSTADPSSAGPSIAGSSARPSAESNLSSAEPVRARAYESASEHLHESASGHVHVEFYPPLRTATKLKYLAGSEQGAGTFVADTLPEESAATLREAIARAA